MARAEVEGGVIATPVPITAGSSVHIIYHGLLSEAGAEKVYLHLGYGNNQEWKMVEDHEMHRNKWGWEVVVPVKNEERFNFCFRDSAYNWDNNNGRNWSYQIHNGRLP